MKERQDKSGFLDEVMFESNVPGFTPTRLKGRDVYNIGTGDLVNLHMDRASYSDGSLICEVPFKGRLMVRLNLFWLNHFGAMAVPHNFKLISLNELPKKFRDEDPQSRKCFFEGRAMLCWNTDPLNYEFIIKGHLTQSDWIEYENMGTVCGVEVGTNLLLGSKFAEPVFAPKRKLRGKPSENVSLKAIENEIGAQLTTELQNRSLILYKKAYDYAFSRGLVIVSTRFEFGRRMDNGFVSLLADELLTPDSTHFCLVANYSVGENPIRHEVMPIQDWIGTLKQKQKSKLPPLPPEVSEQVGDRHVTIVSLLTREIPRL